MTKRRPNYMISMKEQKEFLKNFKNKFEDEYESLFKSGYLDPLKEKKQRFIAARIALFAAASTFIPSHDNRFKEHRKLAKALGNLS